MSMEESLHDVFNGFLKIQSLLDDTNGIDDFLKKIKKRSDGSNEGINIVKKLIDELYKESVNLKDTFYKVYHELLEVECNIETESLSNLKNAGGSKDVNDRDCETDEKVEVIGKCELRNEIVTSEMDKKLKRNIKNISKTKFYESQRENDYGDNENNICDVEYCKDESNETLDKNDVKNECSFEELQNNTSDHMDKKIKNKKKHMNNIDVDNISDVVNSSILNDEDLLEENKNKIKVRNDGDTVENPKAFIRLVDLSKLIDPMSKKDVKLNSSLIVISSDDEPNTNNQNDILISALKKSKHERKFKGKIKRKSPDHKKHEKISSSKHSDDKRNIFETSSESSNSEFSGNQNNFRSSSRLKSKLKSKLKRRNCLRTIFKCKDDKRCSIKQEANTNAQNKNKLKHPINPEDTSNVHSNHSSSSDEVLEKENSKKDNTENTHLFENSDSVDVLQDKKLSCKLYVPLILIECEKLKEVYLRNREILEIKRLRNSQTLKRSRKVNNSETNNSSDEFDKPPGKKIMKKQEEKMLKSNIELTLDKENNPKTDKENSVQCGEGLANAGEKMADIVLDELNHLDKENIEEADNSASENDKDKIDDSTCKCYDDAEKTDEKSKEEKLPETLDKSAKKNDNDGDCCKQSSDHEDQSISTDKLSNEKSESIDRNKLERRTDSENENAENEQKILENEKLLSEQIDTADSDEDFSSFNKRKNMSRKELMRKVKRRMKKISVISDSDDSDTNRNNKEDSEPEKSDSPNSDQEVIKKKPIRSRIKRTKSSSSDDEDDKTTRKHIRKVIDIDALSETTKKAEADEKERKARILEKQKKYNQILEQVTDSKVEKLILEYDEENKKDLLPVHKHFLNKIKPHQASGVRFMWDACFESLDLAKKKTGGGCILAHCMGLGKTLQVIILSHTLLTNVKKTNVNRIMVVCPINTVLNWKSEFKTWLPKNNELEVYELVSCKQNYERQYRIQEWQDSGGVLLIGYTMFRMLSNPDNKNKKISKKMKAIFYEGLVDPGPDLVVCDEGHLLKNEKSHLSIAMSRIKTQRRIVLTGTPLQNNLKEYWCMVQFIKPNLLGTYKEYMNRFVNPITNGQYTNSTQHDINIMRKRSHVLHKLLDGVVQRRDYSVLEPYLPPKHEYVVFINLTEVQIKIYKHYMETFARRNNGSNRTAFLFTDFQELQRICTHPRVLLDKSIERKEKDIYDDESEGSLKDFIDDGDGSNSSTTSSSSGSNSDTGSDTNKNKHHSKKRITRARAAERRDNDEDSDPELVELKKEWWQDYCDGDSLDNIKNSGKLFLLFEILKECEEIGDKVLVFSQSLYTLNCIEYFLGKIDECTQSGDTEKLGGYTGSWAVGLDYFRLDGSSSCDNRANWCKMFNNAKNIRSRLFLISTKAGGLGINLVAANRVIIFDVSWNPSHDIQSIYRVYRFGQTKPCYVYRFVTYGTMEMKIYERQVIKQAISKRVIDEQQIDRHYNQNDIQELYQCDLEPEERPLPMVPKDVLLGELLQKYEKTIYKYHLHQSLLENKECEELNEEERKAAWEEFESEKILRKTYNNSTFFPNLSVNAQTIAAALTNIVKKDNPTWPDHQIRGIIPALVKQLQVQLSENDTSMYTRVQQEIKLMQAMQKQQMSEAFYQQQIMRMIQHQQARNAMLGNMNVNPTLYNPSFYSQQFSYNQGGPSSASPAPATTSNNIVIDLND